MNPTTFYLGAHRYYWLSRTPVPLFISNNTLGDGRPEGRRNLPKRAVDADGNPGRWALDSGGFTMLQSHGSWEEGPTPEQYVNLVRRYADEIGGLDWAAPQDWMCEPPIINGGWVGGQRFAGTRQLLDPNNRLDFDQLVREHLIRTIDNSVELHELAPDLPIRKAVQGWHVKHYELCVEMYWHRAGIDLTREPLVLVGSMCRRQNTAEAGRILQRLQQLGLTRLHGLGFKLEGLEDHGDLLTTADSQAWSRGARWGDYEDMRWPGCNHKGARHTNCLAYALWWRENKVLPAIASCGRGSGVEQLDLFDLIADEAVS